MNLIHKYVRVFSKLVMDGKVFTSDKYEYV